MQILPVGMPCFYCRLDTKSFAQLSDQTSAHFEEQLGQRHFKCFDLEPTSYTLKS